MENSSLSIIPANDGALQPSPQSDTDPPSDSEDVVIVSQTGTDLPTTPHRTRNNHRDLTREGTLSMQVPETTPPPRAGSLATNRTYIFYHRNAAGDTSPSHTVLFETPASSWEGKSQATNTPSRWPRQVSNTSLPKSSASTTPVSVLDALRSQPSLRQALNKLPGIETLQIRDQDDSDYFPLCIKAGQYKPRPNTNHEDDNNHTGDIFAFLDRTKTPRLNAKSQPTAAPSIVLRVVRNDLAMESLAWGEFCAGVKHDRTIESFLAYTWSGNSNHENPKALLKYYFLLAVEKGLLTNTATDDDEETGENDANDETPDPKIPYNDSLRTALTRVCNKISNPHGLDTDELEESSEPENPSSDDEDHNPPDAATDQHEPNNADEDDTEHDSDATETDHVTETDLGAETEAAEEEDTPTTNDKNTRSRKRTRQTPSPRQTQHSSPPTPEHRDHRLRTRSPSHPHQPNNPTNPTPTSPKSNPNTLVRISRSNSTANVDPLTYDTTNVLQIRDKTTRLSDNAVLSQRRLLRKEEDRLRDAEERERECGVRVRQLREHVGRRRDRLVRGL